MFLVRSVCLSVCPLDKLKSCERILTKFLGGRAWPRDQWVQFWWRSGSSSPKSKIGIHWIIKLPTDFDEILRRAGVWPRDQLITFWWWATSLSRSRSPFIVIREELAFSGGLCCLSTCSIPCCSTCFFPSIVCALFLCVCTGLAVWIKAIDLHANWRLGW